MNLLGPYLSFDNVINTISYKQYQMSLQLLLRRTSRRVSLSTSPQQHQQQTQQQLSKQNLPFKYHSSIGTGRTTHNHVYHGRPRTHSSWSKEVPHSNHSFGALTRKSNGRSNSTRSSSNSNSTNQVSLTSHVPPLPIRVALVSTSKSKKENGTILLLFCFYQ